ncbi:hypothetical protein Tco_0523899 [Tanacetum coccineum]
MKMVNSFIPMDMDSEVVKGSELRTEESSKRAGDDLESDMTKKQKVDEHVETEKVDDQEEEQMKKHMEIGIDEEVAIDVIPLATKPLMIVEYKIVREGITGHFQLIRDDGSSKRYSSMIQMLQNMVGYKHNQLKSKSYEEIHKLFDREMKRVNSFMPMDMDSKVVKGSELRIEESSKRAGDDLEFDMTKKQKVDEHVETKKDDDQEEEQMKNHMEIVIDEVVAIDAIPLATKPPMIVEYKIVRE